MIGKTGQLDLLCQILDAAAMHHSVIAQNLANVNTPNYHRRGVVFESELETALASQSGPASVRPRVVEIADAPARNDGNTVDIDVEMEQLGKNTLMMNAATQMLAVRLAQLRSAIAGR